jgi:hypothetical protein
MTTFTKQVSKHGNRQYITPYDNTVSRNALGTGGEGIPGVLVPGSHQTVAQFDDFLGDLVGDEWAVVKSDTGITGAAIANITNGVLRLSGSETQPVTSEGAIALTQGLFKQWKADMGGRKGGRLRMSARIKHSVVSTTAEAGRVHMFVGFSDTGGAEFPAYDSGAGVISPAADLVGLLYAPTSTDASTTWKGVSAKSTAGDSGDQQVIPSTVATPVSNVYDTLEVEISNGISDTGGTAHFFVNGRKIGTINSPVGSGIALTPWIGAWMQDTGLATQLDIDYVAISSPRDTGE